VDRQPNYVRGSDMPMLWLFDLVRHHLSFPLCG
jgi:hypothetical protein